MTTKNNDNVNHPVHYSQHPSGIECIEIKRHLPSNLGDTFKYIFRSGQKGDDEKHEEDIGKAIWYLNDEAKEKYTLNECGHPLAIKKRNIIIATIRFILRLSSEKAIANRDIIDKLDKIIDFEMDQSKKCVMRLFEIYISNPSPENMTFLMLGLGKYKELVHLGIVEKRDNI